MAGREDTSTEQKIPDEGPEMPVEYREEFSVLSQRPVITPLMTKWNSGTTICEGKPMNEDALFWEFVTGTGNAFSIYHDKSAGATAVTVGITGTPLTLTLAITDGDNEGSDGFDLTHASYDTLTELVAAIDALDKGFICEWDRFAPTGSTASDALTSISPGVTIYGRLNKRILLLGTEDSIEHHLDRIPHGFKLTKRNKQGSLYSGDTAWNKSRIFLKSNIYNMSCTIKVY